MKILMTGHEGFIGKNMKPYLESKGHEVTGFEWNTEVGGFPDVKDQDLVIHLGAISSTAEKNVPLIMDKNYEFSYKLLVACMEAGVDMHYASSASIYGQQDPNIEKMSEETIPAPNSPYSWSKYMFDRLIENSLDKLPIKIYGFRYFNVYGPNEEHKGNQASPFTKWHSKSKSIDDTITLFEGSSLIKRDFIHVDDVINMHEFFFDNDAPSGIYNVGTGIATSFETLAITTGMGIMIAPFPDEIRHQYQYWTCADNSKLLAQIPDDYQFKDCLKYWDSLQ